MPKDTFYFSHDYNARNDPKILELRSEYGMEGLGVYWCIIETLAEDDNGYIIASLMGGLSVGFSIPKGRLIEIVEFMVKIELLCKDEVGIYSHRMMEHKTLRKTLSDKGKEGAEKRWKNSPPISPANAKESKEKEIKEKVIDNIINGSLKLKNEIKPFVEDYGKQMCNDFYAYWTEPTKSGIKVRFELERTWDTKRRLERWSRTNFNKPELLQKRELPSYLKGV